MSTSSKSDGKAIRFAALTRVSTEAQEKHGESLRTQRAQNESNVSLLGGIIAGWYGGQEHATPGHERKEVDRLIADAGKGKFDAVIVAHSDRWSRDNAKSTEGLEAFKRSRIRFFVGVSEYDLNEPEHVLFLSLSAVIGQYQAANQRKKSILNRIARMKRGIPSAGMMPYGRTFNRASGQWGIDPTKQAIIVDCARRYLAGEQMPKLAREYRMNHSQLCLTLRERCGEHWTVEFSQPDLNINESVTITIPRLLPEETIQQVRHRLTANRTYIRKGGVRVNDYLLSGHIFCAGCGYSLCGSTDRHGKRHYNHTFAGNALNCPYNPRPRIGADKIEEEVVKNLFSLYGNPSAISRAIRAAVPDCDEALSRRTRLEGERTDVQRSRERVIDRIVRGLLTDEQADRTLIELKEREADLTAELDKVNATLASVPSEEAIACYVERIEDALGTAIVVQDEQGNTYAGGNDVASFLMMTNEERLNLVHAVFSQALADGTPAGVYVSPQGEQRKYARKQWSYRIRGRLEFEVVVSRGQQVATMPHTNLPGPTAPFQMDGNT